MRDRWAAKAAAPVLTVGLATAGIWLYNHVWHAWRAMPSTSSSVTSTATRQTTSCAVTSPTTRATCWPSARQIVVKTDYQLWVSANEKGATHRVLQAC